jgi:hypothetical protein
MLSGFTSRKGAILSASVRRVIVHADNVHGARYPGAQSTNDLRSHTIRAYPSRLHGRCGGRERTSLLESADVEEHDAEGYSRHSGDDHHTLP